MPHVALLESCWPKSRQPLILGSGEYVPSIHCRALLNNHSLLQRELRGQQARSNMMAKLQLKSFLHQFAFPRYCLCEVRLHPLTERHSDAGLKFSLLLHEPQRMLLALNHLKTHL